MAEGKPIIGLMEEVIIMGPSDQKPVNARIDTGAHTSSIDVKLAAELNLGPIIETKNVRSASGMGLRPLIKARISMRGKTLDSLFTIANRDHMKYSVLIGRNILREGGFLIDPSVGDAGDE
ncbi:MAG: RimK/LysX family protein [Candidatus Woesearchaeota archaeon]